jgi:transglutaminase-like putative cysteine protease
MVRRLFFLVLFSVLCAGAFAEEPKASFSIAPASPWVASTSIAETPSDSSDESLSYLLVDYQTNVATEQRYTRIVMRVNTAEGVQDGSSILIDFDPSYQKLFLHSVTVTRKGASASRLSRKDVELLHREPDLESFILDGSLTASLVLKDVRVGDVIDYSYTVKGRNPAFGGRYIGEYSCGWHNAVARERIRVLMPASRSISYKLHGTPVEPTHSQNGDTRVLEWTFSDLPPAVSEDRTPPWYIETPWVELSEFSDWQAVRQWAQALYPEAKVPGELATLSDTWMRDSTDPERRARAALDYVQQNIRYLGIELGAGSYTPRSPETVLSGRFGDCKDQAYLLLTLLHRMGIEASPVLVNTSDRTLIADLLPSPTAFDHVIARAVIGGREVFMDPTRTYQRGSVLARYVPDYGYGLVIEGTEPGLHRFGTARGTTADVEVNERFTVSGREEAARLDVTTIARGDAADVLRAQFASRRTKEIAKDYLNFYADRYPSIQSVEQMSYEDDADADVFSTVEHYTIPGFWSPGTAKGSSVADFFPDVVRSEIPVPRTKVRTSPMEVDYPRRVAQHIVIDLPEPWTVKAEDTTSTTDAFTLRTRISSSGKSVSLSYEYDARTVEVGPGRMASYNRDVQRIEDDLGYRLTWSASKPVATTMQTPDNLLSIVILAAACALLLGCGIMLYWTASHVGSEDRQALPLGGWLIVMAIGLIVQPVMGMVTLVRIAAGSVPWTPGWIAQLAASVAMVLAGTLLTALFFQRRRMFTPLFIWLQGGTIVLLLVELAITRGMPKTDSGQQAQLGQAIAAVIGAAVIIPYCLRSQRAKNTFLR